MIRSVSHRSLIALFAAMLAACGGSMDASLAGEWTSFIATPQGTWTATFVLQKDGKYTTTFVGFPPLPHESGVLTASDGTFRLKKDNGETDEGTYEMPAPNSIVFKGARGMTFWQRAGTMPGIAPGSQPMPNAGAAVASAAPAAISEWPLVGVPKMAQDALAQARRWQPDAIPRGLEADLITSQGGVIGDLQSKAGPVTLTFSFCSPAAQRTKVIRAGGGFDVPDQAGACDPTRAMPDFPDFPTAVAQAQARGMTSAQPKSIAIEDMNGRGVPGEDLTDWVWRIVPPLQSRDAVQVFALNAQHEAVRVVDACAVVTQQDAERAMSMSLTKGQAPYTTGNRTWSCAYKSPGSNRAGMSIQIDESPFRDKHGVMANAQRNGQTLVSGFGDQAYFQLPGSGVASLTVLLGDSLIEMGLWGTGDNERAIKALGRLAIERIVQGSVVATRASLADQLVGNWTAKLYEHTVLLTVRPDHSVNLQMAGQIDGVLETSGARFAFMTRARRELFNGTFEIPRAGRLVTEGAVAAQWHGTKTPAQIPPPLLTPAMLSEAPSDAGPWPQIATDDRLVGLWESNGTYGSQQTRMLWRVRKNGPSPLTWAISGGGYVETPNTSYDRVIVHFAEQLVANARSIQAPLDPVLTIERLASEQTFVTQGWGGFNGNLTWSKIP